MSKLNFSSIKVIKNYFDYKNFDRSVNFRNELKWYDKLDKKNVIYIPIWNSLSLFSTKSEDYSQPVFLNSKDIKVISSKSYTKTFLGSKLINKKKKYFVSLDFSILDEIEIKTLFSKIGTFFSLRDINPLVGSFEGSLLAYSLGISNWHKKNSFCNNCGNKTIITKAGHQRNCLNEQCLNIHFPRTDPAVIMLIYYNDKILLGRQKVWPSGMYSTLAGFVETGETIENAVKREVFEEAGIKIKNIRYHSSQPWPFPASIMLGFYAEASSKKIKLDENEIEDVQWFSRKEIINFSHQNKFLPRKISIARRLIDDWINEE